MPVSSAMVLIVAAPALCGYRCAAVLERTPWPARRAGPGGGPLGESWVLWREPRTRSGKSRSVGSYGRVLAVLGGGDLGHRGRPGLGERRPGRVDDRLGGPAEQVRRGPRPLGEGVAQANPAQRAAEPGLGEDLGDGGAEAAHDRVVLRGH